MRLEASTQIATTPEAVLAFFGDMEINYTRWHPDHVLFRWEGPAELKVGGAFYFEERIGGKLLKKRVRFTRIEPDRIEFALTNPLFRLVLPRIAFVIGPEGDGVRVVQTIPIRTGPIGAWLNRREFDAVRVHMAEEMQNMKRLLEGGDDPALAHPARRP